MVEAVIEDLAAKQDLLSRLDATCRPGVILASNTSSISITALAAANEQAGSGSRHAFHEPRSTDAGRGAHSRPGQDGP